MNILDTLLGPVVTFLANFVHHLYAAFAKIILLLCLFALLTYMDTQWHFITPMQSIAQWFLNQTLYKIVPYSFCFLLDFIVTLYVSFRFFVWIFMPPGAHHIDQHPARSSDSKSQ